MNAISNQSDAKLARRSLARRMEGHKALTVTIAFVAFMGLWHLYVAFIYDSPFIKLPTIPNTIQAFIDLIRSGELQVAAGESFWVLLIGSVPAIIAGTVFGLLIGSSWRADTALSPYIFAFFSTPFPALIPVFILIFGLGVSGKAAIVFTLVVVTMLLQTIAGVKNVDIRYLEAARAFGSPAWRTLIEVQFPAALPFIVAGIRLAIGRALVGVVIAEFDTALSGLGALIFKWAGRIQLPKAFVAALIFSITGILLAAVLRSIERRLERWKLSET